MAGINLGRALRRRLVRLAFYAALAGIALLLLAYGTLRGYAMYKTHRALVLLHEATRIRVGDSEASILPLVARYGGTKWTPPRSDRVDDCVDKEACARENAAAPDYAYGIDLSPFQVSSLKNRDARGFRRKLQQLMIDTPSTWRDPIALRDWIAEVSIYIRAGRVSAVGGGVYLEGRTR